MQAHQIRMNNRIVWFCTCLLLLLILVFIWIPVASAHVQELNAPAEVIQDNCFVITGQASPNEVIWLNSSFSLTVPVSRGDYHYELHGIQFPEGEKRCVLTAGNVKTLRLSLYPVFLTTLRYPLNGPKEAYNGVATLSLSLPVSWNGFVIDVAGAKDIAIYGDAVEDATTVNIEITMSKKVIADRNGNFELNISTVGVPIGDFVISAGGIAKTISIISALSPTPTPTPSPSPSPTPTPSPSPTPSPTPNPSPSHVSLGNALDNYELPWQTDSWFGERSVSNYGGDAAQSGHIAHNHQSCITTTLTGPGRICFDWRVSSEHFFDFLTFYIDGHRRSRISGDTNWQRKCYQLSPGSHILKWCYTKDATITEGSDCGWLDHITFSAIPTPTPSPTHSPTHISLGNALDNSGLPWQTDSWFGERSVSNYGGDAAQSGHITHNHQSCITTTLAGPGRICFDWRVSSELFFDFLSFYIDEHQRSRISGDTNWQRKCYMLSPGSHRLKWCYTKDASITEGSDCGWLDNVQFSSK